MKIKIKGNVRIVGEVEAKSDKFKFVQLVLRQDQNGTPVDYAIQFTNERIQLTEKLHEGEPVEITAYINCNEWQGRYFTNLNGTQIDRLSSKKTIPEDDINETPDDLPF